eukprot:1350415-Ditylum_brightwellii.AAC.1
MQLTNPHHFIGGATPVETGCKSSPKAYSTSNISIWPACIEFVIEIPVSANEVAPDLLPNGV